MLFRIMLRCGVEERTFLGCRPLWIFGTGAIDFLPFVGLVLKRLEKPPQTPGKSRKMAAGGIFIA